jgi:hypothetical protein
LTDWLEAHTSFLPCDGGPRKENRCEQFCFV